MWQQAGKADFEMLEKKAKEWGEPKVPSAKQVMQIFWCMYLCYRRILCAIKIEVNWKQNIFL